MRAVVVAFADLGEGIVLTPQRYEGRSAHPAHGVVLGDLVTSARQLISPARGAESEPVLVIDTTHARHGLLDSDQARRADASVRSRKKVVQGGDVIVSRLRPYLAQIALVDVGAAAPGTAICGSTEFYVLRSIDGDSIAFLVPWLLSEPVQRTFADAQEGGHHPRFHEDVLLRLVVPAHVLAARETLSADVERAAAAYRESQRLLGDAASVVGRSTGAARQL